MFSIKKSKFSDCFSCKLLNAPSCILETNCENNLRDVDIIICAENPGKCFVEKTPILTSNGAYFIEDKLKGKYTLYNQSIENDFIHNVNNYKMFSIKAVKFPKVNCTFDHLFKVIKRNKKNKRYKIPNEASKPEWTTAEYIMNNYQKENIYLMIPKLNHISKKISLNISKYKRYKNRMNDYKIPDFINVDNKLSFILGAYMGDGSSNFNNGNITWHLSYGFKEKYINILVDYIKSIFRINPSININNKEINISIYSRTLVNLFHDMFGYNCYEKRVPKFIFKTSKNIISRFLFGWYITDGSHHKSLKTISNSQKISSVSELGIWDGYILGLKCGTLLGKQQYDSGKDNEKIIHELKFDRSSIKQLSFDIDFLNKYVNNISPHYGEDDKYYYIKINDVKEFKYTGKLYDKQTEKHYYNIPFTVHNSEIEKGIPLIGRAGKTFRISFNKYLINSKYLIINVVLCATIDKDGKTGNPDNETIDKCKYNFLNLIDICKPKLIFCMGASSLKAFGLFNNKFKISNIRGEIYKWKNYDILVTYHPQYINYNRHKPEIGNDFNNDFIKAAKILGLGVDVDPQVEDKKHSNIKGSYSYSIPDKFYSEDYRLIDVHYMSSEKKIIYIFRDKNNRKIYHETNDNYYCYQKIDQSVENRLIVKYDDLNQVHIPYKDRKRLDSKITYEGDIKIQDKHIIDYSIKNKGDFDSSDLNILYMDIEIDPGDYKGFPSAKEAKFPIVLNTIKYGNKIITYVLDNGSEIKKREDSEIKVFKEEKDLISTFVCDLHKFNPNILTGWNILGFDLPYIFNRMPQLGLDPNTLSTFGDVYIDGDSEFANIPGYVIIDMLKLYKHLQLKKRPNNKLGTIAQIELGEDKVKLDVGFSEMYRNHINKYIEYNIRDVTILDRLENVPKLRFIKLITELRKICSGSANSCNSTFGRLDNLVVKHLKGKGLASKNAADQKKQKFPGAYVQEPLKGLHQYIVDFDFKSEYPNLVLTYNIGVNTFLMKFEDGRLGYDLAYDNLPDEFTMIIDPLYSKKKVQFTKKKLINTIEKYNLVYTINGCFYKAHDKELSFYSEVLEYLLKTRDVYKGMMFEAKDAKDFGNTELYDIKQKTYKILANALYGILGNENYRFFNVDLASSITLSGQETTKNSILCADKYLKELFNHKDTDDYTEIKVDDIIIPRNEIFSDYMNVNLEYVITGDTDSIFATFGNFIPRSWDEETSFRKMKDWCNLTQDYLNKDVVIKIIDRHNVPHERNRLEIKNELMCSRGLFIVKKYYTIFVVYQEGKRVDELVMKGLATKRRDFSSYTKECLTELINMILLPDKISFNKINQFINAKEFEFLNKIRNGDKTVAKPVGFTKKLEGYKAYNSGARYPENIESMQNWNLLMYNEFVPGTHGYLFKVQGIDYNKAPRDVAEKFNKHFLKTGRKFTAICVPDEEYRLPEYIIPNVKEALNFAWINRYKQLLEPIMSGGKKMKTF